MIESGTVIRAGCVDERSARDVTLALPLHEYGRLWADTGYACLLDSAASGGRLGRWSFLAGPPQTILRVWRRSGEMVAEVTHPASGTSGSQTLQDGGELWRLIRALLAETASPSVGPSPEVPFVGGAVGYIGYEALHFIERLPELRRPGLGLPLVYLLFVDSVLAFDHLTGRASLSISCSQAARREQLADAWLDRLRSFESGDRPERGFLGAVTAPAKHAAAGPSQSKGSYLEAVAEVQRRIAAGDLYEMNLTYQWRLPFAGDAVLLYAQLRARNPAPFAACLQLPEAAVLSCSPERFLHVAPDGWAETRPIKGTRPRGRSPAEDDRLAAELSVSEKDRAEHAMIVDLLRNDLGRVCRYGTVRVAELMNIESYASVHQIVSTIRGRLRSECDAFDLLRACFPGGSMTGAPKVAAMKLIQELEPVERGIYSGCIGYFDFRGGMDLNIVIRTAVLKDGFAHVGTGGAIVADSDPTAEYQETLHKARPLLEAIRRGCLVRIQKAS